MEGLVGLEQLAYWNEIVSRRTDNYRKISAAMADKEDLLPRDTKHMSVVSNFAVPVVCKSKEAVVKYRRAFEAGNVEIRPVIAGNITRQPFYRKYLPSAHCPNADLVHENGFYFPNNPELTVAEIDLMCRLVRSV